MITESKELAALSLLLSAHAWIVPSLWRTWSSAVLLLDLPLYHPPLLLRLLPPLQFHSLSFPCRHYQSSKLLQHCHIDNSNWELTTPWLNSYLENDTASPPWPIDAHEQSIPSCSRGRIHRSLEHQRDSRHLGDWPARVWKSIVPRDRSILNHKMHPLCVHIVVSIYNHCSRGIILPTERSMVSKHHKSRTASLHTHLMRYLLLSINGTYLINRSDIWWQPAMNAQDATINDGTNSKGIKALNAVTPYGCIAIFSIAFVVESINLGNLSTLHDVCMCIHQCCEKRSNIVCV